MSSNNPNSLDEVFRIEGVYADPHEIKSIFSSAPEKEKKILSKEIKKRGLDVNPLISAQLKKFERSQIISG